MNTLQHVASEINGIQLEKPATQKWVEQVAQMVIPHLTANVDSLNNCVELAHFKKEYPSSFVKLEKIYQALRQKRIEERGQVMASTRARLEQEKQDSPEISRLMTYFLKNSPGRIDNYTLFSRAIFQQFKEGKTNVDPRLAQAYPGVDMNAAYRNGVMQILQNRATDGTYLYKYPTGQSKVISQFFAYFFTMGLPAIKTQYLSAKIPGSYSTLAGFGFNELSEGEYTPSALNKQYQAFRKNQNQALFAMNSGTSNLQNAFVARAPEVSPIVEDQAIKNTKIRVWTVLKPGKELAVGKKTIEADKKYGITVRGSDYVMLAELDDNNKRATEWRGLKAGIRVPITTLNKISKQFTVVDSRMA